MSGDKVYFLVAGSESTYPVNVSDIQSEFVRHIQSYFPSNPVVWVGLDDVRQGLVRKVKEAKKAYPDAVLISLSKLYYPWGEYEINANRLVDFDKNRLHLGPRPGSCSITQQIKKIMHDVGDHPVITVDDTLFHGDTLSILKQNGLRIDASVEYFSSLETKQKLESMGHGIFTAIELDDYLDVMPLHDFLPPLPLCGKVLGTNSDEGFAPVLSQGVSYSFPYLMPWLTPAELSSWASIPEKFAKDFSAFAIKESIKIAGRIWGDTDKFATVMQYSSLRTSIPYLKGHIPDLDSRVNNVLSECLHMVQA